MNTVIWETNHIRYNVKKIEKCLVCGKLFIVRKYDHKYCCRKCFKIDYNKKKKKVDFPSYKCEHCGEEIKLDFHPLVSKRRWEEFECPSCGEKQNEELI